MSAENSCAFAKPEVLRDVDALEAGKCAHADIVKLREQKCVDEVPAFDAELRVIDRLLRDLQSRRPRTQETAAASPIEFRFRFARARDEIRQIEAKEIVAFDHIRIALFDNTRQALDRGALGFVGIFRIDDDQFFPAGIIRKRDARDVTLRRLREIALAGRRKHFELQTAQFFERQLFEKRAAGLR